MTSIPFHRVEGPRPVRATRWIEVARMVRARARLISGLVLLSFVLSHFTGHIVLIVSLTLAEEVRGALMWFWQTAFGTLLLATALTVHVMNALWSIYIRRYLRMPAWELAQLCLGLSIPPLIMLHVVGTKIGDQFFEMEPDYYYVLMAQWLGPARGVALQMAAVLALWVHACIGLHFWLRTKKGYRTWRPFLRAAGVLIPALTLAGYIAGGNQIIREAQQPDFVANVLNEVGQTPEKTAELRSILNIGLWTYAGLVLLPFAGRTMRGLIQSMHRQPRLTHANGRTMTMLPGATVLETLRANGIPHASVCGGRARCTTCRIRVVDGLDALPEPAGLEAAALARIGASGNVRLACQVRPTSDISVVPLLAADAGAAEGLVQGGMEGSERQVTVMFIDLRGSTTLGEAKMPYDVLFILNQFFNELTEALDATGGLYSNFTGDGLMALYGLDAREPALGAEQALRGAREMLLRLDRLNSRLKADLKSPLRIGIGIHFGEAIVGALGPPGSQIVTAIGDTVNTTARLESLSKDYECVIILSQDAARAAGLDLAGHALHHAAVKGRVDSVAFYALQSVPGAV